MFKRIISVALSLIVLGSLIVFIASALRINASLSDMKRQPSPNAAHKRVILIAPELDTPYWKLLEQGARQQAEQYGYLLQYTGPGRHDAAEQQRYLQKAIASRPDAIIMQGLSAHEELIAEAKQKNITVVTVDTDAPQSERIAYVGTDNAAAGKQLAELLLERIDSASEIGVIIGSQEAQNQLARLQAFQDMVAELSEASIVDIRLSNISRLQAARMTVAMLEQHPSIDVIVGLSGLDAVGIVDGLDALDKQHVAVLGFDNLSNTEALIAEGRIVGSIVQQPEIIGKQAIEVLYRYYNGGDYEVEDYVPTTVLTDSRLEDKP